MASGIGRREFITLLGSAAWPLAARAQQPGKLPVIGYIAPTNPLIPSRNTGAFLQRLRELGWIEGQTITVESRWAAGRPEQLDEIAAEFVRIKVDLVVTSSTNDSIVVKQVAPQIPMVFAVSGDPVGYGLVASLARPGGNITGLSIQSPDSAGKRVQLLREIVPDLHRLGIIANPSSPNVMAEVSDVQAAARTAGLNAATSEIRQAADIDSTFELLKSSGGCAVRRCGPTCEHEPDTYRHVGARSATADDVRVSRTRGSGMPDVLWTKPA